MGTLTRAGALALALLLALCLTFQPVLAKGGDGPPAETAEPGGLPSGGGADNVAPPDPTPEATQTPEPAPTPNATPTPTPTPTPGLTQTPTPEPESVSTWAELTAWLDQNWRRGGTVRLDADVTADGTYNLMSGKFFRNMKPMTVDCGAHTIYIGGGPGEVVSLTSSNFLLTIRGQGGEKGLLHVRPGGALMLDMLNIEAQEGAAVVQAEGGVLTVTQEDKGYAVPPRVTGELVYAQRPVLTYQDHLKPYPAVVPDRQPLTEDLLPGLMDAALNYRGELSDALEQPVIWDLETNAGRLERRERTTLSGRPAGEVAWNGQTWAEGEYKVHGAPACTAAFLEDGAALLTLRLEHTQQVLFGSVGFQVEAGAETLRLLASQDEGKSWAGQAALAGEDAARTQTGSLMLHLEDPAYPVWLLVEAIYPDGRVVHTDTVSVDEDQVAPATWGDGHRGGGTPVLPPDTDAPNLIDPPPDTDAPDLIDPPPDTGVTRPPPGTNPPVEDPPGGGSSDRPAVDRRPAGDGLEESGLSGDAAASAPPEDTLPPTPSPMPSPMPTPPVSAPDSAPKDALGSGTASAPEPSPAPKPAPSQDAQPDPAQSAPPVPPDTPGAPDMPDAGEPAPSPAPIVPPTGDAVQPTPAGIPASGLASGAGAEQSGGLPPAAQLALGGAAAAALGAGAVLWFHPAPVRRLLQGLLKRFRKK